MSHIRIIALAALFSVNSGALFAASLYKWVDEEGNTHFSQTPPTHEESAASVGKVEMPNSRSMKPTKIGRDLYCGSQRLNSMGERPAVRIANLEQYLIDRRRAIEDIKSRRLKAVERSVRYQHSSSQSEELSRLDTELSVELCKIDWAEAELATLAEDRHKIADRTTTVKDGIAEVEQQKVATCGVDERTGIIIMDDKYRAYQDCIKPYDREIEKLQRKLKDAERDQKLIEGL